MYLGVEAEGLRAGGRSTESFGGPSGAADAVRLLMTSFQIVGLYARRPYGEVCVRIVRERQLIVYSVVL